MEIQTLCDSIALNSILLVFLQANGSAAAADDNDDNNEEEEEQGEHE